MRFVLRILLLLIPAFLAASYLPWQVVPAIAFVVGLLLAKGKTKRRLFSKPDPRAWPFVSGFIALFLLWGGMALWLDHQHAGALTQKVYLVLVGNSPGVPGGGPLLLALLTALIGGLLGGFSMLSGHFLGKAIKDASA